jgi:peptide deformylase
VEPSDAIPLVEAVEALLAAHPDGALPIVQAGDPVLRSPARPYDGELRRDLLDALLAAMTTTMRAAPGVGLAAPQVGLPVAIAVIEDPGDPDPDRARARRRAPTPWRVLVNPTYTAVGGAVDASYEGCLSVRGYQAVRARWRDIRLSCTDVDGRAMDEPVHGWAARIVQHESDHLRGELYLDGAETRSLCADVHLARWARDPWPVRAADAFGFALPGGDDRR